MPTGDKHEKPCPNCGHCPTCGKSNWKPQSWPYGRWPWTYPQVTPNYPPYVQKAWYTVGSGTSPNQSQIFHRGLGSYVSNSAN